MIDSPLLSLNSILIFFVFGKYKGSKKSSCKCVAKIPDTFLSSRFSNRELASAAPSRADVPLPVNHECKTVNKCHEDVKRCRKSRRVEILYCNLLYCNVLFCPVLCYSTLCIYNQVEVTKCTCH